ncbi:stress responsive A/B barrel domain-containing protein [Poronia punctata]|nr:stress responsive A/B barrel domain-containing protein [Poronia punctata]
MPVNHIVLFKFKPLVTTEDVENAYKNMLALKEKCIKSDTGKPYIQSLTGGPSNSIEGYEDGFQYAFVVVFESVEDRDYYVKKDEAHSGFVGTIIDLMEKIVVFDYSF